MESSVLKFLLVLAISTSAHGFCGPRKLNGDLTRAAVKAAEWLRRQFNESSNHSDGHVTAHAYHSLRLIGHDGTHGAKSGAQQLAEDLAREGLGSISGGRVALYILGVMSVCKDPRNFETQNLVKMLLTKLKKYPRTGFDHPYQYNLAILTLCTAGVKLKPGQVDRLVSGVSNSTVSVDTLSLGVMATDCIDRKQNGRLRTHLKVAVKQLKRIQKNNGGKFGNEISTAHAVMALMAAGANRKHWKCTATMKSLLSMQKEDGSFGSVRGTIQILPALIGALPYDVADLECPTEVSSAKPKKISVCVKVEFDKNTADKTAPAPEHFLVLNGTTAHDLLKLARQKHPCYDFTVKKYSFGHSLTSVCGVQTDAKRKWYWMIYTAPGEPARYGIDDLRPADGSCVIFKFTKASWK